jgi:hypothetical protein
MAANVNVTVTGTLLDGAGAAVGSANVTARRVDSQPLQAATLNTVDVISATSNSSTGVFSLTLIGYDLFAVTYKIILPDGQYLYLRLPPNAKSVGLGALTCGVTGARSVKDITPQFANLKFIGQDLASATALAAPTCDIHAISGTTAITSITAGNFPVGKSVTFVFASTPTLTDGNNIKSAGNLVATADDTWTGYFDGTNFIETGRSVN